MADHLRPLPDDPGAPTIESMIDLRNSEWYLTDGGGYHTAAGETMSMDGNGWQRVVMLEWPARRNHDHGPDAKKAMRLLISPEDALGLAGVLRHTGRWMLLGEKMDDERELLLRVAKGVGEWSEYLARESRRGPLGTMFVDPVELSQVLKAYAELIA